MRAASRNKAVIFFVVLGVSIVSLAVALNVGWIFLNLQAIALLVFGIIFFALIITGITLNTLFLVREIRRNERQDAFLNAVTHELKTPIASIRLYLETLKTRDLPREKQLEFYEIILADNERLLQTVEMILQASRARERTRRRDLEIVDLREIIEKTVELAQTRFKLPSETIETDFAESKMPLRGDETELQSALMNLLDNAVKYSDADERRIAVRAEQNGKNWIVRVRDNGRGLDAADINRIFHRFYRVERRDAPKRKGTGLGLHIVRSIVKGHGGKVHAESDGNDQGSTFVIQLPRAEI